MTISSRLRSLDNFGAPVSFNVDGKTSVKTVGGGIASLFLNILVLGYLCMQMVEVFGRKDP